jgi:hypothetical protein
MKLILFLFSITMILPTTVLAQREHFAVQQEKHKKPSDPNATTRQPPGFSKSIINYQDPLALRRARAAYQYSITNGDVRNKASRSDAYLFLAPEELSIAQKK